MFLCIFRAASIQQIPHSMSASGRGIAFYPLPGRSKLAYDFTFRSINKAKTMTYCRCTFRALKDGALSAFGRISYDHIFNGNFITDPENTVNAHFCMPKSSARSLVQRGTIDIGNYLRENANMTPKQAQYTLLKRVLKLLCIFDKEKQVGNTVDLRKHTHVRKLQKLKSTQGEETKKIREGDIQEVMSIDTKAIATRQTAHYHHDSETELLGMTQTRLLLSSVKLRILQVSKAKEKK
uniref:Uncharacterized protein n=1 Tax=Heterorhabditis bacteriophora TaxID=37862 RepID=A0A1I7WHB7_HETBA